MATKFYSKLAPKQKFYTSAGAWLKFDQIDHDIGVAAITDEAVQADIARATRENRGGITEITGDEYLMLVSKKNENLKPRWREEYSRDQLSRNTSTPLPQSDAVAGLVEGNRAQRITQAAEAAKPAAKRKK